MAPPVARLEAPRRAAPAASTSPCAPPRPTVRRQGSDSGFPTSSYLVNPCLRDTAFLDRGGVDEHAFTLAGALGGGANPGVDVDVLLRAPAGEGVVTVRRETEQL